MRKVVAGLTPSLADGRPFDALRDAAEALARFRSDMPEALEIVGDLQRQGWEEIDTLTLPEELRIHVSQTGDPEAVNRGLSLQVRGSDQLRCGAVVKVGGGSTPLIISDRVGADGKVDEREIPLIDKVLELPYRAAANGWVRREVAFRQATDGLAEDDRLFDTFLVVPEIPVYLLEPHPERDTFLQTTFFLNQALRPTAGDAAADSRFLPKVVPVKDAVAALRALDGREAVVVVPPLASWPAELPAALEAFLRKGGEWCFLPGRSFSRRPTPRPGATCCPRCPAQSCPWKPACACPNRRTHPIWGGFSEDLRQALCRVSLKKRFALTVGEGAEVTARYADEVPLVARRQVGSGRAMFVNTSPDRAWGDWLADGALFVPTVHMLMSSVLTSISQTLRNSPGAGIVGVPFDVRLTQPRLA